MYYMFNMVPSRDVFSLFGITAALNILLQRQETRNPELIFRRVYMPFCRYKESCCPHELLENLKQQKARPPWLQTRRFLSPL